MPAFKDLTGQKFERLTAIYRDKEYEKTHKGTQWHCLCACGKEITVSRSHLTSGHTKSCGCLGQEVKKIIGLKNKNKDFIIETSSLKTFDFKNYNLTNKRFDKILVINKREEKELDNSWDCLCDCGNTFVADGLDICRWKIKNCGCIKKENKIKVIKYPKDLTGYNFGSWTVKYKDPDSPTKRSKWICECRCGTIKSVYRENLVNGNSTSCGCYKKYISHINGVTKDWTGYTFNEITILEPAIDYTIEKDIASHSIYWKSKCSCGNIFYILTSQINRIVSCGCKKSKGEYRIIQLLNERKINYKYQFIEHNCRYTDTNRLAVFDFALFNKLNKLQCLIEYQGEQHYAPSFGWNTEEHFKKNMERDKFKVEYCKREHIPLEIICYKDFKNLEKIIENILIKYTLIEGE